MLRTRLLWFAFGFAATGAAISYTVWKDLLNDRYVLTSEMKQRFDLLETRISKLELLANRKPEPIQDEG